MEIIGRVKVGESLEVIIAPQDIRGLDKYPCPRVLKVFHCAEIILIID